LNKYTVWPCRRKFKNKKKCRTLHLTEVQLQKLFVLAFNELIENKDEIIENCKKAISMIDDTEFSEKEKARLCGESRRLYV
jgi:hypothetical protein